MKSTILELSGIAIVGIGLWLIEPLSLIVAAGVTLVAFGYTWRD